MSFSQPHVVDGGTRIRQDLQDAGSTVEGIGRGGNVHRSPRDTVEAVGTAECIDT